MMFRSNKIKKFVSFYLCDIVLSTQNIIVAEYHDLLVALLILSTGKKIL